MLVCFSCPVSCAHVRARFVVSVIEAQERQGILNEIANAEAKVLGVPCVHTRGHLLCFCIGRLLRHLHISDQFRPCVVLKQIQLLDLFHKESDCTVYIEEQARLLNRDVDDESSSFAKDWLSYLKWRRPRLFAKFTEVEAQVHCIHPSIPSCSCSMSPKLV